MKRKSFVMDAIGLIAVVGVLFCNSAAYGDLEGPFVGWNLDSFGGFKAHSLPGKVVKEKAKALKPFRKFNDMCLDYGPYYLNGCKTEKCLKAVSAHKVVEFKNYSAVEKEFEECCRDLAKLGVVFRDVKKGQGMFHRRGVARRYRAGKRGGKDVVRGMLMADVDVGVRCRDVGRKISAHMQICVRWETFDGAFMGFMGVHSLDEVAAKQQTEPKTIIENLVASKFGDEVPPSILRDAEWIAKHVKHKEPESLAGWKRLDKPFLGMQIVKWLYSSSSKKLNKIRLENNDSEWRSWNSVKMDFNKLRRILIQTFRVPLGRSRESGRSIVSSFEKDGFSIRVCAMQSEFSNGKEPLLQPSCIYVEFVEKGIE